MYAENSRGGLPVLAVSAAKSMLKTAEQQGSPELYKGTIYKGAIDCTKHNSPRQPQPKPKNHKTTNADMMPSPKTSGQNLNVRNLLIRDS